MRSVRVFLALLAMMFVTAAQAQDAADSIYQNGKIYTVNEAQPWVEAVAIKDGKFLVVGTATDMVAHQGAATKVIDLGGRFAMPGIVDPHTHPIEVVHEELFDLALSDTSSPEAILEQVKAYADANPGKEWIIAAPWPFGMFPGENPQREMLDAAVSDRPAFLLDQGGHSAWLNTRALEATGIWSVKDEDLPEGSNVVRDAAGKPSGTIREHAIGFAKRSMPSPPLEELVETVRAVQEKFNALGITTTKIAAGDLNHAKAVYSVAKAGELTLRFHLAMNHDHFAFPQSLEEELGAISEAGNYVHELADPRSVKLYLDGGPLSREAWLIDNYPGTDTKGVGYYPPEKLKALLLMFTDQNRSVMMHAVGDRSVREGLNAIEAVRRERPNAAIRHHLTHNNMIRDKDLRRFQALGLTVEFSPLGSFPKAAVDNLVAILGAEGMAIFTNPRRVLDAGVNLAVASDWTVAPLNPMHRTGFLVTRVHADLPDEPPWLPNAAITVTEAIRASTLGAAHVMAVDKETGSIEVGKFADMIVLDRDITTVPPFQIQDANVMRTVFAGETVYDAN